MRKRPESGWLAHGVETVLPSFAANLPPVFLRGAPWRSAGARLSHGFPSLVSAEDAWLDRRTAHEGQIGTGLADIP
jgi:hypothetical protein